MCGAHKIAREHGIGTILVDERAHGESGGNVTTFGIRERRDVLSWARYAEERFGKERPLILSGVSMGAAAVLMAAGEPLPENVCGIVADCPFSSPEAIIRTVMKGMHVSFLWPSVALSALLFGHFSLTQSSALSGVQNTDLPILLIHGEADDFVPAQMSRDLARAGKRVSLFLFPGAAHGTHRRSWIGSQRSRDGKRRNKGRKDGEKGGQARCARPPFGCAPGGRTF